MLSRLLCMDGGGGLNSVAARSSRQDLRPAGRATTIYASGQFHAWESSCEAQSQAERRDGGTAPTQRRRRSVAARGLGEPEPAHRRTGERRSVE